MVFGEKLFHYQDYAGREIAAVLELENGDRAAFEIKLGANEIDAGAAARVNGSRGRPFR